jgi:MFS family permease
MMLAALVYIIGVVVQISSNRGWEQYAIGRLVCGLGAGTLTVVIPMYQAETAPASTRGMLTTLYQLFITLGILVAESVSVGTRQLAKSGSWRATLGIGLAAPSLLAISMIFMVSYLLALIVNRHSSHLSVRESTLAHQKRSVRRSARYIRSNAWGIEDELCW